MSQHLLTIEPLHLQVPLESDRPLLEALQAAGLHIPADCGGAGLCHNCKIMLLHGDVAPLDPNLWWEEADGTSRWLLACQALPRSDLTIRLSAQSLAGDMVALATIAAGKQQFEKAVGPCHWPLAQRFRLQLPSPSSDDSFPDMQRVERALDEADPNILPVQPTLATLQRLPAVLRQHAFHVTALVADHGPYRQLLDISAPDDHRPLLGVAVDVGTSTVVAQLVNLETSQLLGRASATNAQARYGADVITRIIWAEEHADGPARMQQAITSQISELVHLACAQGSHQPDEVAAASLSGNTTMATLLLGADPRPIRRDPHIPLAREMPTFHAAQLGLAIRPEAPVYLAPPVSGFVGGDITAGVLATGMAYADELSLLVDVGTNGEIVLGGRDWLMCCSCSAGPAFEGVGVEAGVHAVRGAIDRIDYDTTAGAFRWQTIGGQPPIGLCGTGLLEALAAMFRGGILDRNGRLSPDAAPALVRDGDDEREILIVPAGQSGTGGEIVLRESEIENLIRSKGAVYAGISCLLQALDLKPDMIQRVYLAGAFGNRLRVEEAVTIGLLPDLPRDRITFAGNTSLAGAYLALLCRQARDQLAEIASRMTYLELSVTPRFMDEFVAALFLPHTDLQRFPSQLSAATNSGSLIPRTAP